MTTEMTADGIPVPAADEPPAPPVADGSEAEVDPEEEKRRRRKKALLLFLLGLLAMLITIAIWYLIFRQPINPLPPIPVSGLPSYSTAIYGSERPYGVAATVTGDRIYVAETRGERAVRVFDGGGTLVGTAVPPESAGAERVPLFVAIDPLTSEVYVSDRPTGQVFVYSPDGAYLRTLALAQPIPGWQPTGLAFDPDGNLYVADMSGPAPRIEVFDRQANLVRTMGEADQLSFPNGLAVDSDGNVYVADSNNGRLAVYTPEGTLATQVGRGTGEGNLGLPRSVAIDNQGRVFVGDSTGQGVFVFRTLAAEAQRLEYIGFFGGPGVADGQFAYPNGVAVDGRGRVYVADSANNRVQVWSY
jgi:DNA-binding beta-propeller fold protein YncE